MGEFNVGDKVKHKENDHHIFIVADELTSVPPGRPSLFRCISIDVDIDRVYTYLETDLYKVDLETMKKKRKKKS